ncbi:uncharacterized protein LOC132696147 [Cylas formicarius]|uniref:uncharacterized protein LOC132696147 n=1 Tax=Cylas formicarius TaxID=197179 RepID=UPI0029583FD6|nr:uncharacterized protein LOC132696147 [Cylas formicarius]
MARNEFFKIELDLPFTNNRIAEIVYDVLRVDLEPKRSGVIKELCLKNNIVKLFLQAQLARQMRVAINNFFEKVDLVIETIESIGPPTTDSYNHY